MLWDQLKEQQDAGNEAVRGPIDTIDELAKELGLDADALKSEINAYNGYCKEKKDLEFNKDPQYLFALDEGPYYAFELKVGIFSTVGGMKINNDCQVLDEKNMPIANLLCHGMRCWRTVRGCIRRVDLRRILPGIRGLHRQDGGGGLRRQG